jgi:hypothetical protein
MPQQVDAMNAPRRQKDLFHAKGRRPRQCGIANHNERLGVWLAIGHRLRSAARMPQQVDEMNEPRR